jgi:hypothetical protein
VREIKVKDREIEIILVKKTKNTMPYGQMVTVGYASDF